MNRTQKIALRGMLIAVAFVLSWLEAQLPPLGMVPGIKLGLTNLVVLVAIYRLGTVDAMVINGIVSCWWHLPSAICFLYGIVWREECLAPL